MAVLILFIGVLMTSQNEWYVCGDVAGIDIRRRSVVVTVKGKIFRPKVFGVNGIIDCFMSKELYKSLNVYKDVEFTGHMIFGKDNHLLVETIKDKKGVILGTEEKQLA
jgi:hypothetical protein